METLLQAGSKLPTLTAATIFNNFSLVFPVFAVANTGSCVGPQNKIDNGSSVQTTDAGSRLSAHGILIGFKT